MSGPLAGADPHARGFVRHWSRQVRVVILAVLLAGSAAPLGGSLSAAADDFVCPPGLTVSDPKIGRLGLVTQERMQRSYDPPLHVMYRCAYGSYGITVIWVDQPAAIVGLNTVYRLCGGAPDERWNDRNGAFEILRSTSRGAMVSHSTDNSPAHPFDIALVHDFAAGVLRSIESRGLPCAAIGAPAVAPAAPAPAAAPAAPATPGRPLCPEAVSAFSADKLRAAGIADTSRTGIRVDGGDLLGGFRSAVKSHNARFPDDKAYVSLEKPFAGTAGALAWLFSEGGVIEGQTGLNTGYVTGKELDLYNGILRLSRVRAAEGKSAKLLPSDVLEVALDLTGGNLNAAILASHNMLRAKARGDATVQEVTGLTKDEKFFATYLADMRDGAENPGIWYHTFGTAYLEASAADDSGPWLSATGMAALYGVGSLSGVGAVVSLARIGGALTAIYTALETQTSDGVTAGSKIANAVEQFYREHGPDKRTPDPEKYCFNVWGAQAGRSLYEELPYKGTRKIRDLVSSFRAPLRVLPAMYGTEILGPFLNVMSSPYSVEWSDGQRTMVLDQGADISQARLLGDAPILALPLPEPDSWGALWVPLTDRVLTVRFEAAKDGAVFHLVRVDTTTGKAAVYETTATRAGERFTVALDPATLAPPVTRGDGTTVKAEIRQLDLMGQPSEPAPALAGAAIAAMLLGGGALLLRNKRRGATPAVATATAALEAPAPPPVWPAAVPPAARRARFCGQCGTPLREGSRFCGSCGAPA